MGGRAGGGARGGGGGMSDSAIARMAKDTVPSGAIDPAKDTALLSGDILIDHSSSGKVWLNARIPAIEQQIEKDAGQAPANPTSRKGNAKYVAAYNAYYDRYMAAMAKGVASYKSAIGKQKNPAIKSLLATKVKTYQGYMKEAGGVKEWINKAYK